MYYIQSQHTHTAREHVYRTNTIFASFANPYRESSCEPWIAPRLEILDRFLDYILQRYGPVQAQQVLALCRHDVSDFCDVRRRVRLAACHVRDTQLRRRIDFITRSVQAQIFNQE
jgi:hypothetical protein